MSDLGLTIAWLAVQVALLLVPALAIQTTAARRGPASGAWVAALSLGLVLALSATILVPRSLVRDDGRLKQGARHGLMAAPLPANPIDADRSLSAWQASARGATFAGLRLAWARFERGAAAPAVRFRSWGKSLAVVALAGSGVGLLRLLIGLWAVGLCHRRGRAVEDPGLTALLVELRCAMGCRRRVELREVSDLTSPATAGWWSPVVFLPDDWRSWDDAERRAVLAHELAHILRGDYAIGLMAQAATVVHAYHPLVRWMAGRLQIQQELAADALGARFAGGPPCYLVALSRLALRQDGRSPCWPARAFLPPQGTLIRRIAMLRQDTEARDRTWSRSHRVFLGLGLMGLAGGVAMLRGPALGAGADPPADAARAAAPAARTSEPEEGKAIELVYVPDNAVGVVAFRPAATFRRPEMEPFAKLVDAAIRREFEPKLVKELRVDVDLNSPGLPRLRPTDIEWVTCGVSFRRTGKKGEPGRQIMFSGLTIRTIHPFDWVKMLNAWGIKTTEVREGRAVYHRFSGSAFGPTPGGAYCPDDRTLVVDNEVKIRSLFERGGRSLPAFVQNTDWARASRGLLAVAFNSQNGAFWKEYDLGQPDDAIMLSLLKGVDRWVLDVPADAAPVLHATAAIQSPAASAALLHTIESLRALGQGTLEHRAPEHWQGGSLDPRVMAKTLLANLRVERTDRSIDVRTEGFGTLADLVAFIEATEPSTVAK